MEIRVHCPDEIHIPRIGKPDHKKKLYINPLKNVAHCFVCGFKTRRADHLVEKYQLDVSISPTALSSLPEVTLRLPKEFRTDFWSTAGKRALDYLLHRHISKNIIIDYELGFCTEGRYAGRIIIPFYQSGILVFFQARDYLGTQYIRYDSPSKADGAIPNRLFNIDRASHSTVIVLVEGPLDALRLPQYAVAIVGSGWNTEKQQQLLAVKPRTVLLAMDHDEAGERATRSIEYALTGLVPFVARLPFPGKDLGGLSPTELAQACRFCDAFKPSQTVATNTVRHHPQSRPLHASRPRSTQAPS